jgi:hypothetical protein
VHREPHAAREFDQHSLSGARDTVDRPPGQARRPTVAQARVENLQLTYGPPRQARRQLPRNNLDLRKLRHPTKLAQKGDVYQTAVSVHVPETVVWYTSPFFGTISSCAAL